MTQAVWLWWSSGKDSAWALHRLRRDPRYRVEALVTTINRKVRRVAMHAVRESLLESQAARVGSPLRKVFIPHPCSNRDYEEAANRELRAARDSEVFAMAFGDLFLEDIRRYREDWLDGSGVDPVFPVWGLDTRALAEEMLETGLEAVVTCIDPKVMPESLAGADYDRAFLEALPVGVDPCGENGEFHTFAYAGPMFGTPLSVRVGEVVHRDGFVFADLLAAEELHSDGGQRSPFGSAD